MRATRVWVLLALLLQACQCGSSQSAPAAAKTEGSSASAPETHAQLRAPIAPDLASGAGLVSPYDDGLWRRAANGDPLDLTRLAGRHGASGLLRAARAGGTTGRVALAALAYAPEADAVLLTLCHWLSVSDTASRPYLLSAVHEVLQRAPSSEEADPARRDQLCLMVLGRVASESDPALADLSTSAAELVRHRLGR